MACPERGEPSEQERSSAIECDESLRGNPMPRNRYFALGWICLSLVPCAFPQGGGSLTAFRKVLDSDGFDVRQGSTLVLDAWSLYCGGLVPGAAFNNKGAPYVTVSVPRFGRRLASNPTF